MENSNYSPPPPPTSNTSPTTPTALLESLKNSDGTLPGSLAASIAPADMLNVWNATKLNNKNSGMVNTADGKLRGLIRRIKEKKMRDLKNWLN